VSAALTGWDAPFEFLEKGGCGSFPRRGPVDDGDHCAGQRVGFDRFDSGLLTVGPERLLKLALRPRQRRFSSLHPSVEVGEARLPI
jgi:hypothetical protein